MSKLAIRNTEVNGAAPAPADPRNPFTGDSKRASEVAKAGWILVEAKEAEVRKHFQSLPVEEGLQLLATARKHLEIAAYELNQRIEAGAKVERCSGCGKTLEEVGRSMWIMQGATRDPETGLDVPYRYCHVQCVRERNRRLLMPKDASPIGADGNIMGDIK